MHIEIDGCSISDSNIITVVNKSWLFLNKLQLRISPSHLDQNNISKYGLKLLANNTSFYNLKILSQ